MWRREWRPTLFSPGESHGQSSLAVCSLVGHKRVGRELVTTNTHTQTMQRHSMKSLKRRNQFLWVRIQNYLQNTLLVKIKTEKNVLSRVKKSVCVWQICNLSKDIQETVIVAASEVENQMAERQQQKGDLLFPI